MTGEEMSMLQDGILTGMRIMIDEVLDKKLDEKLDKKFDEKLKNYPTKDDLKNFATKDDLKNFATKDDLKSFATKDDLKNFATKDDIKKCATKDDMDQMEIDLYKEIGRLQRYLEEKIQKLEDNMNEMKEYYRITRLETDNTKLLFQMLKDLEARVNQRLDAVEAKIA